MPARLRPELRLNIFSNEWLPILRAEYKMDMVFNEGVRQDYVALSGLELYIFISQRLRAGLNNFALRATSSAPFAVLPLVLLFVHPHQSAAKYSLQ